MACLGEFRPICKRYAGKQAKLVSQELAVAPGSRCPQIQSQTLLVFRFCCVLTMFEAIHQNKRSELISRRHVALDRIFEEFRISFNVQCLHHLVFVKCHRAGLYVDGICHFFHRHPLHQ
jgi:hypothetical protein